MAHEPVTQAQKTETNLQHKIPPAMQPHLPTPGPVHPLLHLQRTIGNRAVQGLIQTKLKIGQPGDRYEQEADRVADQVMRMPAPSVQRQVEPEEEEEETLQAQPLSGQITPLVQRQVADEEEETLQPKLLSGQIARLIQRQMEDEDQEESIQTKSLAEQTSDHLLQRKCAACASGQGLCPNCAREEEGVQRKPLASTITPLIQRQNEDPEEEEIQTMPVFTSLVQRQIEAEEEEEKEPIQAQPISGQVTPLIQRQIAPEEEEETIQAKQVPDQSAEVPSTSVARIQSLRSGGRPLPESTRAFFEPRFGYDFTDVRVHTDGRAAEIAQSINAKAFTIGRDVVFGTGQYVPETPAGKMLLGHELTHVVQQQGGSKLPKPAVPSVQAKLTIGSPGDRYEQEADRVADQVMRMPVSSVQRQIEPEEEEEEETLQPKLLSDQIAGLIQRQMEDQDEEEPIQTKSLSEQTSEPLIQRKCAAYTSGQGLCPRCAADEGIHRKPFASTIIQLIQRQIEELEEAEEEETLQTEGALGRTPSVSSSVESRIQALRGGGQPLPESTRAVFEPRFRYDFSRVRVHTDGNAAESARAVNARAFTVGQDVVFGAREYAPESSEGQRLLAHELTHVVQQTSGLTTGMVRLQRQPREGDPTSEPTSEEADTLEHDWQVEQGNAEHLWKESDSPTERAWARRLWVLLNELRPDRFTSDDQLINFLDWCHETANSEDATLKAVSKRKNRQELLWDDGMAFPSTWAEAVYQDFHSPTDLEALYQIWQSARSDALTIAVRISDEVWARGLPLTISQARNLSASEVVRLVLNFERATQSSRTVFSRYARALLQWLRSGAHYSLVKNYNAKVAGLATRIRQGEIVVDKSLYLYLGEFSDRFYHRLETFEDAASTPGDLEQAFRALRIQAKGSRFYHDILGNLTYSWPGEGVDAFRRELQQVDQQIAGTSFDDSIRRALIWAHERDYFSTAGREVWESIKENGWKILAVAVGIIVAQFIPGVNIALDIVLIIEFGLSAVAAVFELASTLKEAGAAKSVVQMERASARLAQTLVGKAAEILLWAISLGAGKVATKAVKWRRGKKFLDKHGNTPEAREALANSKGNVRKAERTLSEKRRGEAEKAPKGGKPPPNKPIQMPKVLEGAGCSIGSLNCPRITKVVRDEVDPYPHPELVPEPKGSIKVRGLKDPEYLKLRSESTRSLRKKVLDNPQYWTKEFKAALKAANKGKSLNWLKDPANRKKLKWPRGGLKGTGRKEAPAWEVHHKKPVDFGGDASPANLIPIPKAVHNDLTTWWRSTKKEYSEYFSGREWRALLSGRKTQTFSSAQ